MGKTTVFFRDDDVGRSSDRMRRVMDLLLEKAIPCHYQVVPMFLDDESAVELRSLQESERQLIFFNQHGLRHEQELDGHHCHSEFDGERSYADQFHDIERGKEILGQKLGASFSPSIFTPPCHKYDAETIRVLGDLGFEMISAGVRTDWPSRLYYGLGRPLGRVGLFGKRVSYHQRFTPDSRVSEVSVAIDVHEDVDASGRRIDKSCDALWREFTHLRGRLSAVGVMLHHEACDTLEKFEALGEFVRRLAADPDVHFATMHELAPRQGAT